MAYRHILDINLEDKGFSVIRKNTYERTENDTVVETLTSERKYDFGSKSDRSEVLGIILKHMIFGKRMEDGLEEMKKELDEIFKEIQDELPFT